MDLSANLVVASNHDLVRCCWAKALGIDGPHWMILMALQGLDRGDGASVEVIADTLQANPIFVTAHTRLLEKKGFVRRSASARYQGALALALTEVARERLAELVSLDRKNGVA